MPELDEQIDTASSDVSVDDAVAAEQTSAGETAAAASSPAEGEQDADLLSVVRDVVKESRGQTEEEASPAPSEEETEASAAADDDEDYSDVPFNKHPRFRQVTKQNREFKEKISVLERELEPLKVDAERYQNVVGFLDQAGLTADEAADMLQVGGLMKTNPVEAWQRIKPVIQNLLIAAGEVLPDDLQQRVQNGEFSREAAIEISKARAAANSVRTQQSFREQREQMTAEQNKVAAVRQAAADWEADRVRKDPNFAKKLPDIEREIVYLQRTEGVPNTPEGVKDQLMKAYKTVNDRLRPAAPAPTPKASVRPVMGGQVAGNQQPTASMSTLDIIRSNRRA